MQTLENDVPIVERLNLGNLVTPVHDKTVPIYNWYLFKHSYSRELVDNLLDAFEISKDSYVLDPFCGSGTTLMACAERGISARGYDILPFSVFVTNTKIQALSVDSASLKKQLDDFKVEKSVNDKNEMLKIGIIQKGFKSEVLEKILDIRYSISRLPPTPCRDILTLGLLSILEFFSQTEKGGGFLRLVVKETKASDVLPAFEDKIKMMIEDLKMAETTRKNGIQSSQNKCFSEIGDSRNLPIETKFDACITSPPYPNRHDYTRIYSLELITGFGLDDLQVKEIRYKTLRSHVEARPQYKVEGYVEPVVLTNLVESLTAKKLNNNAIVQMLKGYFEDMYLTLREVSNCLKDRGKAAFVVSNVRFEGLTIPVDSILSKIGEQVRLQTEQICVVRYRGNSSQQMARYSRIPSRESIVIFRKK